MNTINIHTSMRKASLVFMLLFANMFVLATFAQKELTILHTNDTHSTIYPLSPNLNDTSKANRGGFIRRIAMIKEERQKDPNLLLIDSGDFSQGSAYYNEFKGEVEVQLMNRMGYDVGTIGNHEFDFGLDNMARLFRMAKFPIVCANYDFTGTPVEGLVKPYIIMKRNGLKIGLFGLCPAMEGLVDENKCKGVKYLDPVKVGLETATLLKKEKKCDVVICVSHLGWDMSGGRMDDEEMTAGSRNIDVILGGHSHTYFTDLQHVKDLDGKDVPNDQNGKHGIFVGKLKLHFNKAK